MPSKLEGQNVIPIQDGWSNNQSITGTCMHNGQKRAKLCSSFTEKKTDFCEEIRKCKMSYPSCFCTPLKYILPPTIAIYLL